MDGVAKNVARNYNAYVHQQINLNHEIVVTERQATEERQDSSSRSMGVRQREDERQIAYSARVRSFDINSPYWGGGGAVVSDIELLNSEGEKLATMSECGYVTIRVHCKATQQLEHPIVGFMLRNQRGIEIISENTDLGYMAELPPVVQPGQEFFADFSFFIPYMPTGDYFIGGAIADRPNSSVSHIQHHRRDDALKFSILTSHVTYGLFSMPIRACSINLK